MISAELRKKYVPTIGIECHVQLKTKTKLFAAVNNDARDAEPNTLVSHICFGLPGALPVLNREAVRLAARAAFALGTRPSSFSKFDRKHYFYPDLPKGYQISQFDQPIIGEGAIDVLMYDETTKATQTLRVGITRAHLEEDAGKSTHPAGGDYSLVDLNRAGTPLLEIVSMPDMHSAAEAKAYVRELYLRMKYAGVSDCDMYLGQMRFDVNVSISIDLAKLGTRSETKNLNSFRSVEKAIEYEVDRQIELLEKGQAVVQETRGWDDAKQRTFSQRTKEEAHDYRYMPDPDLPPVVLDEAYIAAVKRDMPTMPGEWRVKLQSLGIDAILTEVLLEAETENVQVSYLPLIDRCKDMPDMAKYLVNWMVNVAVPLVREGVFKLNQTDHLKLEVELYSLVLAKKLSSTNAKVVFENLVALEQLPSTVVEYAESQGYIQNSDEDEVSQIVAQVLADNLKAAEDIKTGEMKAIGFIVGQVMKASKGKANPSLAQQLIKKQLGL
jgi:aspartyl-tRNA(Asn)/glutamyl-tRNA(Gln) amidotransferase subunit B